MKHSQVCQDTGWVLVLHTYEEHTVLVFLVHGKQRLRKDTKPFYMLFLLLIS